MILYVNGDSHTAAAEAVNLHAFAEDDSQLFYMGRAPHPENLAVSWGTLLSKTLKAGFFCGAESASSNTRIIRTTREFLEKALGLQDILLIIQWSTWEREEWLHNGTYYQVNASGQDMVPQELQEKYRHYILGVDWQLKTEQAHKEIWKFHQELKEKGVRHIFFNGNNSFNKIQEKLDWGTDYIGPYDPDKTFNSIIKSNGIDTVSPKSYHFGKVGHSFFSRFMLQLFIDYKYF